METKKHAEKESAAEPSVEPEPSFSPGAMAEIMARVTSGEGEDRKELRRNGCNVVIYPEQARPNALKEPIKVRLEELTPDEELTAYKKAGGVNVSVEDMRKGEVSEVSVSQQALATSFARRAIVSVNGRKLTADEREVLWNILNMQGRMALGHAYMAACGGADAAGFLEKSLASLEYS